MSLRTHLVDAYSDLTNKRSEFRLPRDAMFLGNLSPASISISNAISIRIISIKVGNGTPSFEEFIDSASCAGIIS